MSDGVASRRYPQYFFERGFHVAAVDAPAPAYSASDLARERAAGFVEGRSAGLSEAAEATNARLAAAIEAVAEAILQVLAARDAIHAAAVGEAIGAAAAICAKLLPDLYRRHGTSEIEAVVADVLTRLFEADRVDVRVNPADLPLLTERLAAVAEKAGFAARLSVRGDEAVASGDCRVDWGSGGAERNGERLWQDIEMALAAALPLGDGGATPPRLRLTAPPYTASTDTAPLAEAISDSSINDDGGDRA